MRPKRTFAGATSTRLADFTTGKATLREDHKAWLNTLTPSLASGNFKELWIFGFASKLGFRTAANGEESDARNTTLSFDRASEVVKYLEKISPRVTTRVRFFKAEGSHESGYNAAGTDNSAAERAVEVHLFMTPPPPPPFTELPPCSGGRRYLSWSISSPGGASFTPFPGTVIAGNYFGFRNETTHVTHWYFSPAAGVGASYSGPNLGKLLEMIKSFFGKVSFTGVTWTSFTADTPFNFSDLQGATLLLEAASAGAVVGISRGKASVSGPVWFRDSNLKCMFARKDFVNDADVSGTGLITGVSGSALGGPLLQAD